MSTTTTKI